jgi:hypothetical protein
MSNSQLSTSDQLKSIWHLGGLSVGQPAKRVWAGINAQVEHAAAERGHPESKPNGKKLSPAARDAA